MSGWARDVVGIGALLGVGAGVYGIAGWPWALISVCAPIVAIYLWGELRPVKRG